MKTFTFFSLFESQLSKKLITTAACCLFLGIGGNSVFAQDNLHVNLPSDPHNNPAIWAALQQNPLDSLLWQKYVHQQWTEMPLKERLQVKLWIQEMWLNKVNGKTTDTELIATNITKKQEKKEDKKEIKKEQIKKNDKTEGKNENVVVATKKETTTKKTEEVVVTASTEVMSKTQKMNELLSLPEVKSFMKDLEESFLAESTEMGELKENLYENFFILEAVLADEFEVLGAKYVFYKQKYPKGNYSESRWMMEKEEELKKLKTQKLEELKQAFLERQIN